MLLRLIGFESGGEDLVPYDKELPKLDYGKKPELREYDLGQRFWLLKQKILYKDKGEEADVTERFKLLEARKKQLKHANDVLKREVANAKFMKKEVEDYLKGYMGNETNISPEIQANLKKLKSIAKTMEKDNHFGDALRIIAEFEDDRTTKLKYYRRAWQRIERKYSKDVRDEVLHKKLKEYDQWLQKFFEISDKLLKDTKETVLHDHPLTDDLKDAQFQILHSLKKFLRKNHTSAGAALYMKMWKEFSASMGSL